MDDRHPEWEAIVRGARACVGARFRMLGRGPGAFDCLGVVLAAAAAARIRLRVPDWYDQRWFDAEQVEALMRGNGLRRVSTAGPGDVVWRSTGVRQHFGLWTGNGLVEADAALRRVVERPGLAAGEGWRLRTGE